MTTSLGVLQVRAIQYESYSTSHTVRVIQYESVRVIRASYRGTRLDQQLQCCLPCQPTATVFDPRPGRTAMMAFVKERDDVIRKGMR